LALGLELLLSLTALATEASVVFELELAFFA
jgi:hypothetical protein